MKTLRACCLINILFCFLANPAVAQLNTIGIPNIFNYPKENYHAGRQNWGIAQDKNGVMFFANSEGLLTFDGVFWKLYPLPNKTIVRSIGIAPDGRVYVGGQGEIGYFLPDKLGRLEYFSLKALLTNTQNQFTDVWNICITGGKVFFRTNKRIFEYNNNTIIEYKGEIWSFMGIANGRLFAVESKKGLVYFDKGHWLKAYQAGNMPSNATVRASVTIGEDSIMLPTLSHGIYILHANRITPFSTPDVDAISKQNIYNALPLTTGKIALITNLAGCIIIDNKGRYIQQFSKQEGIQNNHILSILKDKDENIWLGLDNGIDLVTYNNAIKRIFPEKDDRNSAYAAAVHDGYLYVGLSTGLFRVKLTGEKDMSFTLGRFEPVNQSKGQVWNLSVINNQLLMGHTKGAFLVNHDDAAPIDTRSGTWNFQLSPDSSTKTLVAGNYNGLVIYPDLRSFSNETVVPFESARFVVWHNDIIWVAHPYIGLYKVKLLPGNKVSVELYKDTHKFLSENYNNLYRLGDDLVLTTAKGIFTFNDALGDFQPSKRLQALFGKPRVSYLKMDPFGNIWFCRNHKAGVVDQSGPKPRLVYLPELDDKIMASGFEYIHIVDSNNVLIAGEKGFFHVNYGAYKKSKYPIKTMISQVRSGLEGSMKILHGGYAAISTPPSILYRNNALYFQCSAVLYGQAENTEYSYFLEGFDNRWSAWAKKTEKEYVNLPAGKYSFKVKSRNNYDNESPETVYSFEILPPWYQTIWAYIIWFSLFISVLFLFYKIQQRKYKRQQAARLLQQQQKYAEEQERLHIQHQLEVEKNEREIEWLRNEKLQAEVDHKNQELASTAMNLVRKIEMLSHLKENLLHYRKQVDTTNGQKEFQKIIKGLDKELDFNEEWERFSMHFDTVHANYLQRLQQHCPTLTNSELKLAAYLKLNLTSKEIAQLMNISVRGVETSRYRLRKKLELDNEVSLTGFLSSFTNS